MSGRWLPVAVLVLLTAWLLLVALAFHGLLTAGSGT